jgi:putative N6-adenine-specific DNA methylase
MTGTARGKIYTTCAKGLEGYLAAEVKALGLAVNASDSAGVEAAGSMHDAMALNLFLRTGLRVLLLFSEFTARTPEELYDNVVSLPWEDYIHSDGYFSVTASVDTPSINNPLYAGLKCKDAIADRFTKRFGTRPDSGPDRDRTVIHLYWKDEHCSVYLDTSGEPLSKRGYRQVPVKAPLQEPLAAALVMASGWHDDGSFVNPMCGSGTLAIEAALMGLDRAPGIFRKNFGFMHLRGFDHESWSRLRKGASSRERKALRHRIVATDISREALDAARRNALTAGVGHIIEFRRCSFEETEIPAGKGVVMINPEYGERMGKVGVLEGTYAGIGDFFKRRCQGYRGYVFTGNAGLAKRIGLRAKRRMVFFNGPIECRLLEYDIYEGSR